MLEFCPKCKNILIPEKNREDKIIMKCHYCGFFKKYWGKDLIEKEKIIRKEIKKGIIPGNENEFADYKHKCEKCGYAKAQIIDMGLSYSDEDNLILLKCGKCGWSERVGQKVS